MAEMRALRGDLSLRDAPDSTGCRMDSTKGDRSRPWRACSCKSRAMANFTKIGSKRLCAAADVSGPAKCRGPLRSLPRLVMKRLAQIPGLEGVFGARWLRPGFVTQAGRQNSGQRCTLALNRCVLASAFRCQGVASTASLASLVDDEVGHSDHLRFLDIKHSEYLQVVVDKLFACDFAVTIGIDFFEHVVRSQSASIGGGRERDSARVRTYEVLINQETLIVLVHRFEHPFLERDPLVL